MFCSHCGVKASGNFCFQCGSSLRQAEEVVSEELIPAFLVWEDDADYQRIARHPDVRTAIASMTAQARPGLSAEAFMEIADKVVPIGVSYSTATSIAQPLWASLGVRTGRERSAVLAVPIGRAIARVLCSLAKNQQPVQQVEQGTDACTLQAELPASVWALKGTLTVKIAREEGGCIVSAATEIPGQGFDWGMSQRCLDTLLLEIQQDLGLPPSQSQRQAA